MKYIDSLTFKRENRNVGKAQLIKDIIKNHFTNEDEFSFDYTILLRKGLEILLYVYLDKTLIPITYSAYMNIEYYSGIEADLYNYSDSIIGCIKRCRKIDEYLN